MKTALPAGLWCVCLLLASACSEQVPSASDTAVASAGVPCTLELNDLLLTNGKFITVDPDDSVVSHLRIVGDRIVAVGDAAAVPGPCTRTIDLGGRTAIPGLIDNHNHWVGRASRPGHHVAQLDSAFAIADVLGALSANLPNWNLSIQPPRGHRSPPMIS